MTAHDIAEAILAGLTFGFAMREGGRTIVHLIRVRIRGARLSMIDTLTSMGVSVLAFGYVGFYLLHTIDTLGALTA